MGCDIGKTKLIICYVNFVTLLIVGVITFISGLVLWLIIPSGGGRVGALSSFLGLKRGTWEDIHAITGIILGILTLIHLVINWDWIKSTTKCLLAPKSKENS